MLRITRVLHATDFSPRSRSALKYSLRLARLLDVPVAVIHVVPSIGPNRITEYDAGAHVSPNDTGMPMDFDELRGLCEGSGVDVRFYVGYGPLPGPVILEEAQREKANLIVLGAHGGGSAQPNQLGSVSTDIVRRSTCPVLIVPPHVDEGSADQDMERVVTFVSYAHRIEPVLVVAAQIARLLEAHLDVLAQVDGLDAASCPAKWADMEANLWDVLTRIESSGGQSVAHDRITFHAVSSPDADEVVSFARDHKSDILVLEAPGLASMDAPLEQIVEETVGRAPCPVILMNTCGRGIDKKRRRVAAAVPEAAA